MKAKRDKAELLADRLDIPADALGLTKLSLCGRSRLLIENHGGVTGYGRCRIQVRVRYGLISVCGEGLQLARMTREQLVISGRVDSVTLCRREK